jgi:hypothetical protein
VFDIPAAIESASKLIDDGINKIWPSPTEKASAQATIMKAQADAAISQMAQQMSVMLEEAKSGDKWTSRARPSFLYVIYLMILSAIPMGVVYAFDPIHAALITQGLQQWLAGIPQPLWDVFGYGYMGYVLARSGEKAGGLMNFVSGKKK